MAQPTTEIESAPAPTRFAGKQRWLLLLLPPLLAFIVHVPALWSELFWDDESLITEHPRLSEPGFYREIFRRDYGLELAPRAPSGYYRPALMVVNFGLFQAFGRSALAYHAAVLLAFCFSAFLLTKISWRALGDSRRWLAIAIGCLGAVHPIRTEFAVFFMSMPDLLLEIFALLMIGIALKLLGPKPNALRMMVIGGLAFAAAVTKETSFVTFGALAGCLFLSAYIPRREPDGLRAGLAIFLGLALGLALRKWEGIAAPGAAEQLSQLPDGSGRALQAVGLGLRDLLAPTYPVFMRWNDAPATTATMLGVSGLILVASALVVWLLRRAAIFPAVVAAWASGGMLTLMMIRVNNLPYADRYVPSGALIIALCLAVDSLWRSIGDWTIQLRRILAILAAGYIGASAVFAWLGTMRCVNALAFFTTMADDEPQLAYPRLELANLFFFRYGDFVKMEQNIREAAGISPNVPAVRAAGKLLAKRFIVEKRYAQGLRALDWAGESLPDDAELWSLRASCLSGLRDFPKALAAVDRALQLRPNHAPYERQRDRIGAEAGEGR